MCTSRWKRKTISPKKLQSLLQSTPEAIRMLNKSKARKIELFHVTR
jgi:hypothetical protein